MKHQAKRSGADSEHASRSESSVLKMKSESTERKRKRRKVESARSGDGAVDGSVQSVGSDVVPNSRKHQEAEGASAVSVRHKSGKVRPGQGHTNDTNESVHMSNPVSAPRASDDQLNLLTNGLLLEFLDRFGKSVYYSFDRPCHRNCHRFYSRHSSLETSRESRVDAFAECVSARSPAARCGTKVAEPESRIQAAEPQYPGAATCRTNDCSRQSTNSPACRTKG